MFYSKPLIGQRNCGLIHLVLKFATTPTLIVLLLRNYPTTTGRLYTRRRIHPIVAQRPHIELKLGPRGQARLRVVAETHTIC